MTEKEIEFKREYLNLLNKYNVTLTVTKWSDEYGSNADVSFKENGEYCNINYVPNCRSVDLGNCGMGQ